MFSALFNIAIPISKAASTSSTITTISKLDFPGSAAVSTTMRFLLVTFLIIIFTCPVFANELSFGHLVVDSNGPANMHIKSVGDLNGDGLEDLIIAGTNGEIVWYENSSLTLFNQIQLFL